MAYKPIKIDRQNLTIMGVRFSDLDTLNSAVNAIGSNMFEGFEPTTRSIEKSEMLKSAKAADSFSL